MDAKGHTKAPLLFLIDTMELFVWADREAFLISILSDPSKERCALSFTALRREEKEYEKKEHSEVEKSWSSEHVEWRETGGEKKKQSRGKQNEGDLFFLFEGRKMLLMKKGCFGGMEWMVTLVFRWAQYIFFSSFDLFLVLRSSSFGFMRPHRKKTTQPRTNFVHSVSLVQLASNEVLRTSRGEGKKKQHAFSSSRNH